MAGNNVTANPLVVTGEAPDTSLNVQLHPLVLLTISDYITRHTIRKQVGPIVGAVIGQQSGRNFTLEVAFECKLAEKTDDVLLDGEWFAQRLDMYKEVHKVPALDLVALFALGPVDGPQQAHLPILRQVQALTNSDSVMLLLFHPQLVDNLKGGKLPISLYESLQEAENDEQHVRFRELAFEVETSDAEMIGVDFVAKGGGNAAAVSKANAPTPAGGSASTEKRKGKGKGKAKEKGGEDVESPFSSSVLSPEDDEIIASLTAKANAIKMLNERINLIRTYLTTLPPSYLTDASSTDPAPPTTNFQLLRSMSSMLSRVPLLAPQTSPSDASAHPDSSLGLDRASANEKQDVHLTTLLASLTRSVAEAQGLGFKYGILMREKASRDRSQAMGGGGGRGGGRFLGVSDGSYPTDEPSL